MAKAKLLYVEDDDVLSFITKDNLEHHGYEVIHYDNGAKAIEAFESDNFDICILDVMLPEVDGFEVAEKIREIDLEIPIIFLTAKSLKEDRIHGLKIGGDDYITKPYSIEELVLKIDIFLRRKFMVSTIEQSSYKIGQYHFDFKNLRLTREDETRNLTQREGELLNLLVSKKNNIIERSTILKKIWGQDDYFLGRSLDVFISRLRKYLSEDPRISIENIHGVGFRMSIDSELRN